MRNDRRVHRKAGGWTNAKAPIVNRSEEKIGFGRAAFGERNQSNGSFTVGDLYSSTVAQFLDCGGIHFTNRESGSETFELKPSVKNSRHTLITSNDKTFSPILQFDVMRRDVGKASDKIDGCRILRKRWSFFRSVLEDACGKEYEPPECPRNIAFDR